MALIIKCIEARVEKNREGFHAFFQELTNFSIHHQFPKIMNKLTLFSTALICCYFSCFGQKAYDEGKKLYDDESYSSAIAKFKQNLKKNEEHADSWYYLGLAYRKSDQNAEAIDALGKCVRMRDRNLVAQIALQSGRSFRGLHEELDRSIRM